MVPTIQRIPSSSTMNTSGRDPILDGPYSDQRSCYLLKLSLELRLHIWEYVCPPGQYSGMLKGLFGNEQCLQLHSLKYKDIVGRECGYEPPEYYEYVPNRAREEGHPSLLLSIGQTCRVVYQDVIPLLYGNHTFIFFYEKDLISFLSNIPSTHLQFVRHVVLNLYLKLEKQRTAGWASQKTRPIRTRSTTPQRQARNRDWSAAVEKLLSLPKLKMLNVNMDDNHIRQPKSLGYTDELRLKSTVELLRSFTGKRNLVEGRWVVLVGAKSGQELTDYVALLDATLQDEGIPFEAIDPHKLTPPFPPTFIPSYMMDMIVCYALPPDEDDDDL
ncbi:uncharacterized protein K452DRAFT_355384 [Aplosporella prunicola CBS 121167]|uniref:DUF7730 domain-containing protein n=1 Tax=Aplosporella prunicola CBS 121167 TaxID=1176127 RepID=A0A6A6BSN8_9PEZI|nr:uncharacterized protein K452DRAFT_355384 [Aplosporella prunicola CBS 121167]KAF2146990.1 hypothetical protein K452DRAFT_355384 [Aplosporella prunicola CBS 121167]